MPQALPLIIFLLTYVGLALGRIPGLALDRTGFALLGAVAFLATGEVPLEDAKQAVDAGTLAVLFGMMILSALYQQSGLYTAIGRRLALADQPRRLLLGILVVAALLSALLTNDVICFALTPVLAAALLGGGLEPLPFLLALACAANLGSALTPIGNPQNILIAQRLHLAFLPFVGACALPVLVGLAFTYWWIGRDIPARRLQPIAPHPETGREPGAASNAVALDRSQAVKAVALTVAAIALFLTPVPAGVTALAIAGVVLTSRKMHTRAMLALVDWHTLALFIGLFVVNRGFEHSGWAQAAEHALAGLGANLGQALVLVPAVAVLGNLVGNVPAVMLLLPFVPQEPRVGWAMALVSTFAGNAFLIGSIANIIVAEQAARLGLPLGFKAHLKVGLPVTLVSLLAALLAMSFW